VLISSFLLVSIVREYRTGLQRLLLSIVLLLTVAGIYFTYTRSIWLGFAATLVVLTFFQGQVGLLGKRAIVIIVLLLISGVGSKLSIYETTLFDRRQSTVDYRLLNYDVAIKVFKANPLTGIGYGLFGKELEKYFLAFKDDYTVSRLTDQDGNHNTYLGLLAEVGLLGFGCYIAILFCLLRMCYQAYKQFDDVRSVEKALAAVGMALIVSVLVTGQFSDLRFDQRQLPVMFFILGVIASVKARCLQSQQQSITTPTNHPIPAKTLEPF